jgi:hypothetical protein
MTTAFHILILPNAGGEPPTVLGRAVEPGGIDAVFADAVTHQSDTAMVARAALHAMAHAFVQGQPVRFGPEIPAEVLK